LCFEERDPLKARGPGRSLLNRVFLSPLFTPLVFL
jgi:hypothetical protein